METDMAGQTSSSHRKMFIRPKKFCINNTYNIQVELQKNTIFPVCIDYFQDAATGRDPSPPSNPEPQEEAPHNFHPIPYRSRQLHHYLY